MFEHFTDRARAAVVEAQRQAQGLRHGYIGTEHLLLGVLATGDNVGARALSRFGVGVGDVRKDVVRIIGEGPSPALDAEDERALGSIGIDLDQVRRALEAAFGPGALDRPVRRGRMRRGSCARPWTSGAVPFTPRAKKTLELALREARALHHGYLGTEHVLLGIAREGEGVASQILQARGIDRHQLREAIRAELAGGDDPDPQGAG